MYSVCLQGTYTDIGVLRLDSGRITEWQHFSDEEPPRIPFGTKVEITIIFNDQDFLSGENGIVWATYDQTQAETIQNSLLVQNILSEIEEFILEDRKLHILRIPGKEDVEKAKDFIWRDAAGLRLQLDWHYPAEAQNESFKKWINGG
jgi:hypothetical protein